MKKIMLSLIFISAAIAYVYATHIQAPSDNANPVASSSRNTGDDTAPTGSYTIENITPGTFYAKLRALTTDFTTVTELTLTGSLNDYDMKFFASLKNLQKLDLTQTDISEISGCNGLASLTTVLLPSTVTKVAAKAFSQCEALTAIQLPNVTEIGESAFSSCKLLETVTIPNTLKIESNAFSFCDKLTNIDLSKVTYLGSSAFYYCTSISSVDLSSIAVTDYNNSNSCEYAFAFCKKLTTVVFPETMSIIPHDMFSDCESLHHITLPKGLKKIGNGAFENTAIADIELPEGLITLEDGAFRDCILTRIVLPSTIQETGYNSIHFQTGADIYCKAIIPPHIYIDTYRVPESVTVHVPSISLPDYMTNENWQIFSKIEALDEKINSMSIFDSFIINDYDGLADHTDINLVRKENSSYGSNRATCGHLSINNDKAFEVGSYIQYVHLIGENIYDEDSNTGGYGDKIGYGFPWCTTLTTEAPLTADDITINLQPKTSEWNFISFPFDVNVSDITVPEGTMWVIRKYSGYDRAAGTGNTWQNMNAGTTLRAGEGYILHCFNDNLGDELIFTVKAAETRSKNAMFTTDDASVSLSTYPSEFAHNRSWNLIGNPYPSYYRMSSLDFSSPVTVWERDRYVAYSPLDDDYTFHPFEAFFVQCPDGSDNLRFPRAGRTHEAIVCNPPPGSRVAPAQGLTSSGRIVLNFTLSGAGITDRARLVLNDDADTAYETDRDASKFLADNNTIPQIFINNGGVSLAIDERPVSSDGTYILGTRFGTEGECTLSLDTRNFCGIVTVTDLETGIVTDLTDGAYQFAATPGMNPKRFQVKVEISRSAIDNISAENSQNTDTPAYNLKGQQVAPDAKGIVIRNGHKTIN